MKHVLMIIAVAAFLISCEMVEDADTVIGTTPDASMPNQPPPTVTPMGTTITMGTFSNYGHGLGGRAVLSIDSTNKKTLRLENFNMTAGPDVYVFVSKSNNYSMANTISVTKLTNSYSNSTLSFNLSPSLDTKDYKFVLVYCVAFNSLFGYAELK